MPKITADNMRDYYDFKAAKEGGAVTVLIGKKKSTDDDPTHPESIVFKQGLGAAADLNASLRLQGKAPGFLPVIASGDDYFIREAYPEKIATKWSQLTGQAKSLISQAMTLSLAMLDAGVVDRDRSITKGTGDNLTARNLVMSDRLYFFDFEPERIIDWGSELSVEDIEAIELWKSTHENLIKGLATNLGFAGQVETLLIGFRGAAEKVISTKGERALKIWHGLLAPVADSASEYQPPVHLVNTGESTPMPSVSSSSRHVHEPPVSALTVDTVFKLMKDYHTATTKSAFFLPNERETIEKMARAIHVVNNRQGSSYETLEAMINRDKDLGFRKTAHSLLDNAREYLIKAYEVQLHDKDELWAKPRGPWGH
ncbi:hypothetical protein [Legionella hackeliae]|uniref:Uncharacterized protein n=1 Tax=Legionella hackeliae TaxID=449 RepID=A0A0A8UVQ8_LEGHA|nr:hypothetical protein [Legionella hackeliae]KTD15477.1 hypothetical protein Lhac_0319 [Legionella hackeliae]CEK11152.1 protein of unknown function [Legionella hackeliae]STX47910.1 Uncharacterised protein [Legionella hackeliae]